MAANEIALAALDLAQALQNKAPGLREQYLAAESHATRLKAECDRASMAPKRLASFKVKVGADYQCPRCFIESERHSALLPLGNGRSDVLRCKHCHYETSVG